MYPRKLYVNMVNGQPNWRCACFKELGWSDIRQVIVRRSQEERHCRTHAGSTNLRTVASVYCCCLLAPCCHTVRANLVNC